MTAWSDGEELQRRQCRVGRRKRSRQCGLSYWDAALGKVKRSAPSCGIEEFGQFRKPTASFAYAGIDMALADLAERPAVSRSTTYWVAR